MTGVVLLDVNVLVALFDPDHVHHEAAHAWFSANRAQGWATCPLTENAVVRILSNPSYTGLRETPGTILRRLTAFCASGQHVFWPDRVSILDRSTFGEEGPPTHRHVTDVYLLGLAKHNDGRLATFDRRIPLAAVVGAERGDVELIPV